jgi:polyisoprenoid-binding protein YceI
MATTRCGACCRGFRAAGGAEVRGVLRACLVLLGLACAAPMAHATDWVQQSGVLTFATRYQGEVFSGRLPGFRTRMAFDPARPEQARIDVVIPLAGADSGNAERDDVLRGEDFFDVARHGEARFSAEGVRRDGDGWIADGRLQLRGVSQPVRLRFTWTAGPAPELVGRATVRRLAFGVGGGDWADTGLIPDEVAVSTRVRFRPVR